MSLSCKLLLTFGLLAVVHGKPQDVVFPEGEGEDRRPPIEQDNGIRATTPNQFQNPSRPLPNQNNFPNRPPQNNFPNQHPRQNNNFPNQPNNQNNNFPNQPNNQNNNFPNQPNNQNNNFPNQPNNQNNNFPNQPNNQNNNFPNQPNNQNNFPAQPPTTGSSAVTQAPTGNATTTRIPPRDPGNRIVYLVPAGCNCPFTYQYSPVCGTDGQTYGNMGVLQCNRQCGKQVDVYLVGACGRNNG